MRGLDNKSDITEDDTQNTKLAYLKLLTTAIIRQRCTKVFDIQDTKRNLSMLSEIPFAWGKSLNYSQHFIDHTILGMKALSKYYKEALHRDDMGNILIDMSLILRSTDFTKTNSTDISLMRYIREVSKFCEMIV